MDVCMYVYKKIYIYTYIYICLCICIYIHAYIYTYRYTNTYVHTRVYDVTCAQLDGAAWSNRQVTNCLLGRLFMCRAADAGFLLIVLGSPLVLWSSSVVDDNNE